MKVYAVVQDMWCILKLFCNKQEAEEYINKLKENDNDSVYEIQVIRYIKKGVYL